MQPSKIEWLHWPDGKPGYSWNPIKGICPVGCWYCYARKIYKRFGLDPEIRQDLDEYLNLFPKKPSRIFVCSTFELFHPLADPYRDNVFKHIEHHPQHTFLILTKLPGNIDRPMPENVWLGVSVTNQEDADKRIPILLREEAKFRFVSIEPILESISFIGGSYGPNWLEGWETITLKGRHGDPEPSQSQTEKINWCIIGQLTGRGEKYGPEQKWIIDILNETEKANIPAFMKNNLASIWPGKLIQEFPGEA